MNRLSALIRQGRSHLFPHRLTLPTPVPAGLGQQSASANPPDKFPGRELMFTLIREHLMIQHQTTDLQDTKAAAILVGGTTLVGFAFLIQHHPVGNCSSLIPALFHHWPLIVRLAVPYVLFLLFYIFTVIFALRASRIRGYWHVPNPVMALKSMKESEQDLKLSLSKAMAHFSGVNQAILDEKARLIRWAGRMLLGETITLVLLLLYQTVC